jgi:hypothetical protein
MRRAVLLIVVCVMGTTLGSCGLADPYQTPDEHTTSSTTPRVVDNEVRPARPYRDDDRATGAPAPTPTEAVAAFAELYVNWTYATLAETRRSLGDLAVGEAAAAQRRAAAETSGDYELRRGKVENHGEIVTVAPQRGASAGHFVVVTRETTTGAGAYDGLPPAYHVTLVTTEAIDGGYAVSSWRPQS